MIESPPFWMYIVGLLLVIGPLVTIHELGHYLVGRLFGVKAEAFSVGFGKELAGFTDRRGTRWKLSALPLGGYVQFKGDMNPASIPDKDALDASPEEERRDAFHFQPLWQRALIVFAGPAINLLAAIAILASFALFYGKPVPQDMENQTVVARFSEESVARAAGVEVGDRIVAVDDKPMKQFQDIVRAVAIYPGRDIELTVQRDDERIEIPVTIGSTIRKDRFGNESKVGVLGIYSTEQQYRFESVGLGESIAIASRQTVDIVRMMGTGIGQIFTGERSVRELGGPVRIAKYSGEQLSLGLQAFAWFAALISINLAFINLLPIPALDGGHLAFYAAEAVRRKPIGPRGQEWAFRAGVALVLMLMLFVTVNDVVSLTLFGS